jgi:hypothetical protein
MRELLRGMRFAVDGTGAQKFTGRPARPLLPRKAYRLHMITATAAPTGTATLVLLEQQWDAAMEGSYQRAGDEVGYWAGRFRQMLTRRGGLGTARQILRTKVASDGYTRLRQAGRLDLTVEAYMVRPEFAPLFTEAEVEQARIRIAFYERVAEVEAQSAKPAPRELTHLLAAAFAYKVMEAMGHRGDPILASDALRRLKVSHPELADLIDMALVGLK